MNTLSAARKKAVTAINSCYGLAGTQLITTSSSWLVTSWQNSKITYMFIHGVVIHSNSPLFIIYKIIIPLYILTRWGLWSSHHASHTAHTSHTTHTAHSAAAHWHLRGLLGGLRDDGLSCRQERRDAGRIQKCCPYNLQESKKGKKIISNLSALF